MAEESCEKPSYQNTGKTWWCSHTSKVYRNYIVTKASNSWFVALYCITWWNSIRRFLDTRYLSTDKAATHPEPAAVTACLHSWSYIIIHKKSKDTGFCKFQQIYVCLFTKNSLFYSIIKMALFGVEEWLIDDILKTIITQGIVW